MQAGRLAFTLLCLWLTFAPIGDAQVWTSSFPTTGAGSWTSCSDNCAISCGTPPTGWSQIDHSGSGTPRNRHFLRRNDAAPTASTGAKWEHTTLSTGGNSRYIHAESGTGGCTGSNAGTNALFQLTSPSIDLDVPVDNGETLYLSLFVWMYGTTVGSFRLRVNAGSGYTTIYELQDSSRINNWVLHQVDIGEYIGQTINLRFEANTVNNIYGDISVDDVEIYNTGAIQPPSGSEANATWFGLSRRYPEQLAFSPFLRDHVGVFVDNGEDDRTIRMWGGYDANNALSDKVHVYDVDDKLFLTTSFLNDDDEEDSARILHNAPLPRDQSAYVALDDRLLIYGGSDYRGPVEDVDVMVSYSYATGNFTQLTSSTSDDPAEANHFNFPAEGSSMVVDPATGDLYLYGGRTTTVQLNFVSRATCTDTQCQFFKLDLQSGPPIPRGRWGHISTFVNMEGNKRLFIFGGRFQPSDADTPEILGDVVVMDLGASPRWRDVIVHDPRRAPAPRAFPAGAQNEAGDKWIIYGGMDDSDPNNPIVYNDVYMLTFDSKYAIWRELSVAGDSIPRRAGHVMVPTFIPAENQEAFLIFGGYDGNLATANSVEKLDFGSIDSEVPPPKTNDDDDGDDDSVIIIAVVLSVVFGLCLLLLLALLIGTIVSLLLWKAHKKKALQRKYGIGNASATEMEALNE